MEGSMNNFSPSMLKTFANCPKKYNFKFIEKINLPQNPSLFEKGKKIHAIANFYHRNQDISKLEKALTDEERIIWEKLKNNKYFAIKCLHSEYPITARIDDIWISGRIDALVEENNNFYILDYKTGSIPKNPDSDFQTMIYLLCADLILTQRDNLFFVYIDLKNDENKVIKFSPQLKQYYQDTIKKQCHLILSTKNFDEKENKQHCKFCEYNKLCN